ncbi:hypothetical protein FJ981_28050 [Mesorhizobium sp. B1-1-4]|uniref:hypothetical protein n=1 Tax=Mesorhizobium sp. B1-1-4 TaxID=2589980 RepID=UPI00112D8B3C|nr:hypothetical protein [Mesorhizobium sp. B1-1-4]TPN44451.1 hypothetical protein FJ981_28050 [Mesorhizobium sp. B1-1-4]
MSKISMFALGALGGILPILVSLLTVDFSPFIDGPSTLTTGNYVGYAVRIIVLIILGGIIASLNSEVRSPITLVQLGIAAPALITSYINGSSVKPTVPSPRASIGIFSSAYADPIDDDTPYIVSGGWLGDFTNGFSTRLDRLQMDNLQRDNGAPVENHINPPAQPPPEGLGAYCGTTAGRFGPSPLVALGTPCWVPTPNGVIGGEIVQ